MSTLHDAAQDILEKPSRIKIAFAISSAEVLKSTEIRFGSAAINLGTVISRYRWDLQYEFVRVPKQLRREPLVSDFDLRQDH